MMTKDQVINALEGLVRDIKTRRDLQTWLLSYHLERDDDTDGWKFSVFQNDGFGNGSLVVERAITNWNAILCDPFRPLREAMECVDLVERIKCALGTEESGDGLVEVARNAHRAELEAAQEHLRIEREDVDFNEGPIPLLEPCEGASEPPGHPEF